MQTLRFPRLPGWLKVLLWIVLTPAAIFTRLLVDAIPESFLGEHHFVHLPVIWLLTRWLILFLPIAFLVFSLVMMGYLVRWLIVSAPGLWRLIKRHPWIATTVVGILGVLIAFWQTGREINKEFGLLDNNPKLFGPGPLFLRELSLGTVASLVSLGSLALLLLLIVSAVENRRKAREAERQAVQRWLYEQRRAEEERHRLAAVAEEKRQREEAARKKREAAARAVREAAARRFRRFMSRYDLDSDLQWYMGNDTYSTYYDGHWCFKHVRDRDSREFGYSVIEQHDGEIEVRHYRQNGNFYAWTDEDGDRFVINSPLEGPGGDKVWPLYRQYLEAYRDWLDWDEDEEEEEDD